ncbi:MAG: hypothetical protein WCF98_03925 [Synechococcus sp. ELA057]
MADSQFEFAAAENRHFEALAKYSIVSALALLIYGIANASFLFNVYLSGKIGLMIRTLDDLFVTLAALFAANQLRLAARSFRRIVNTQGSDLDLLNLSNQKLRLAFASLAIVMVALAVRFILDYPILLLWIQRAAG